MESEIVQFPAIIKDGVTIVSGPDLTSLTRSDMVAMANLLGGVVAYVKVRAVYEVLETALCTAYECYRPADKTTRCKDHRGK